MAKTVQTDRPELAPLELPGEPFPWPGEELYYSVRVNDAEALRASVRAGHPRMHNDLAYVPISGVAQSVGFFNQVYPLDDRGHTFIDPSDRRPLRSEKDFEERGKTRTYRVDYALDDYRARVEKSNKKHDNRFNYAIPEPTHDMMSWMYALRSESEFAVGDEFSYYVYDGWKLSRVNLEVVAEEDVLTPMGWFKSYRLSFVRQVLDSKRKKASDDSFEDPELKMRTPRDKSGHLWLSRDENRLPIKVSLDTKFGKSEAVLIKYEPHDEPTAHPGRVDQGDEKTSNSTPRVEPR
ncbi:MAG: DUF3108 domain-containing protein [Persicimonas sp.]